MEPSADVPRLAAKLMVSADGSYQLRVKCDWCRSWHTHGGPIGGHRMGHCWRVHGSRRLGTQQRSPYLNTGYWLDVQAGEVTPW